MCHTAAQGPRTWLRAIPGHEVLWLQAQLVERDVLLLDLGSLHGRSEVQGAMGHGAAGAPGAGGPQQSQYLALYNWRKARVLSFLASTSDAAIAMLHK